MRPFLALATLSLLAAATASAQDDAPAPTADAPAADAPAADAPAADAAPKDPCAPPPCATEPCPQPPAGCPKAPPKEPPAPSTDSPPTNAPPTGAAPSTDSPSTNAPPTDTASSTPPPSADAAPSTPPPPPPSADTAPSTPPPSADTAPSTPPPSADTAPSTPPPPAAHDPAEAAAAGKAAAATATAEVKPEHRVGDPIPLTRREPTLKAYEIMVGARYGLVGTGPTRFVDDIRFGITDSIELRTDLLPYPSSLMVRARFGSPQTAGGAVILDAGLAHWDAGFRIVPDTGESAVGTRFHFEGVVGYEKTFGDKVLVGAFAHYRYRLSFLNNDDEHAVAVDGHVTYDLLDSLAVSAGLGVASTIVTPVRELSINFVETGAPGISHLLARDEGGDQSVTIPLTMTYGRVENFDVDLFCTPRVWPELGILFGAGVRLRLDPFTS